jgi:transcriptional regulator with GAF, ATPase, and Fis domain
MPSDSDQSKRRPVRHALFLGLAVVVIVHALFAFYRSAHLAYTGVYVSFLSGDTLDVIAIDPESPGDLTDLRPGDQILRVGNQEIRNQADVFVFKYLLQNEPYSIVYRRGASTLTGQLIPDAPVFPFSTLFGVILSTLFLGLGLTVYLKKSWDPGARIFYLLISCLSAACLGLVNVGDFINKATPIMFILPVLIPPLSLHLRLIFPERIGIIARYPRLLALIYLPFLLGALYGYFLIFKAKLLYHQGQSDLGIYHQFDLLVKLFLGLLLVYMVMGFVLLARTLLTNRPPEVKRQIKWIFWGDVIAVVLLFAGLPLIFQEITFYSSGARNLPFTLIFATLAYLVANALAIFKYRLMDIDIVIHRSLSYLLVSGIIVLLYFILFGTFGWIFGLLTGRNTPVIYIISAMVIGFLFRPLLSRIEEGVERLFYRERYELHQALGEVSQALITVLNPMEIFEKVYCTAENSLHIRTGCLWLLEQQGGALNAVSSLPEGEGVPVLSRGTIQPLALYFMETRKGLTRYMVSTKASFGNDRNRYLKPFEETKMEILLPLIYKNTLLGMVGFGEKRSGDLYASEDVALLTTLAHQIAMAMQNARAHQQSKQLNVELGVRIREIENQQEEILALQQRLLNENIYLREEIGQQFDFTEIIGSSKPIKEVLTMVEKIAPTLSTVFVRGETGTGKELISRAIHFNSPRKDAPLIKINCAVIPANLLESELFGHEKGAFTGAERTKSGKFELADRGTIFLDEIGDLAPNLQVKLMRVLQEKEFERVGGTRTIKVDVRIIAATNRDIEKAISCGAFREDLFYRLNVISIPLPPLRERKEDIRELTIHFLNKFSRNLGKSVKEIEPKAMEILKAYHWPGNIRELANVLERAVVLGEGGALAVNDLPHNLAPSQSSRLVPASGTEAALPQEMGQIEKQRIIEALEKAKGNKSEAARMLGLKRGTFYGKLRKFDIS